MGVQVLFRACKHNLHEVSGLGVSAIKALRAEAPGSKEVIERRGTLEADLQSVRSKTPGLGVQARMTNPDLTTLKKNLDPKH